MLLSLSLQVPGWTEAGQLRTESWKSKLSPALQPRRRVDFCVTRCHIFAPVTLRTTSLYPYGFQLSSLTAILSNLRLILVDLMDVTEFPITPVKAAQEGNVL